ncbi:MAG TPA: hypothetical protein VMT03_19985 [Polyangia bacterium]|nr:hypothetical protein [Polyangia bacterium]
MAFREQQQALHDRRVSTGGQGRRAGGPARPAGADLRKHHLMAENILDRNAGTASTAAPHGGAPQGRRGPGR